MELDREYADIRTALAWCIEVGEPALGLRLAGSLLFLWQIQGGTGEGLAWTTRLLALPGADAPTVGRARSLAAVGRLAQMRADPGASQAACDEALSLARQLGEPLIEWLALLFSMNNAFQTGHLNQADEYGCLALTCARGAGDAMSEGQTLMVLGQVASGRPDYATAEVLATEALRLARAEGDRWNEGWALALCGHVALGQQAYARSQGFLEAGIHLVQRFDSPPTLTGWLLETLGEVEIALGLFPAARASLLRSVGLHYEAGEAFAVKPLERLAALEAGCGQWERALRLAGAADALRTALDMPRREPERERIEAWVPPARERLTAEIADAIWTEGRTLGLDGAVALARTAADVAVPESSGSELTVREREVAALLTQGMTNRQIARRLVISERTVAAHVEHILNKLGFASRHQVAVWALEHDLST
jgi:DNA-binding CsgD family transcriptional regulator